MDAASKKSVLSALVYADLFDYPLTANEVYRWQISESSFLSSRGLRLPAESVAISPDVGKRLLRLRQLTDPRNDTNSLGYSQTETTRTLAHLVKSNVIQTKDNFYFLPNRTDLVAKRRSREIVARRKLVLAHRYAKAYSTIPTIKAIFLTGSLAIKNAKPTSDLDFMFITSVNTLWLTRVLIYIISFTHRIPIRRAVSRSETDRVCPNLLLDESDLFICDQNLYTAHEIAQVVPLFDRNNYYHLFLSANSWLSSFLPCALPRLSNLSHLGSLGYLRPTAYRLPPTYLALLNRLLFLLQRRYMRQKQTNESISLTQAFFHPTALGPSLLQKYRRRLRVILTYDQNRA